MADNKTKKLKSAAKDDIVKVAAIQMASSPNVAANLVEAKRLIEMAAKAGAKLVVLPEYFCIMGLKDTDKVAISEKPNDGPIQHFLSKTAKAFKLWIIAGSVPMQSSQSKKIRNSCLVYNEKGEQVARYDKIHLFGLDMGTEHYHEENTIEAGDSVVAIDTPYGRIGLSI
jgi:deaminated glutathione amidase